MNINFEIDPKKTDIKMLYDGLVSHNKPHFGFDGVTEFGCFLRDEDDNVMGGASGYIAQQMAEVRFLWIDDSRRGQGAGSKLIKTMEQELKQHGVSQINLDTYSFQAPEFYKKIGFTEVARFMAFKDKNIEKIFFTKDI